MKVMTVLGTRPEIIRLSLIIPLLDKLCQHVLVHTGQNFVHSLNEVFFDELKLRKPDYLLKCQSETPMGIVGKILIECEKVIHQEKPDRILILGDTNSALTSIVAKRLGIPVFHMEAGNRCFDDRVPEEVNRRIVDHSSDVLLPYTERSRQNLLREGIASNRIYVTGNPIKEIMDHYFSEIDSSAILATLRLEKGKYFLVTLHRAENVDIEERLVDFIEGLHALNKEYRVPVICSLHPRTRSQLEKRSRILENDGVRAVEPLGLFDFVHLEKNAMAVLSDSGTVQEECSIFKIPNVTLRDVTERPETIEVGSNILSGGKPESIMTCVRTVLNQVPAWEAPPEYMVDNVSHTIARIVLGY